MAQDPATEWALMRALRAGDETAFEATVAQYTDLVYAACLRVLGRADAAEDAAQAVFLQLARKAPELGVDTILPAWLYRTAHFIARRAQTAAWRRAKHEREAQQMRSKAAATDSSEAWAEISPRLDAALDALPEHYREVLVLHYLCGKKQREVAEALQLKESTVSMRVQRGLEKLRVKLLGREATVSAGAVGVLLETNVRTSAPAHLPGKIRTAQQSGTPSPAVEELAKESLRTVAHGGGWPVPALLLAGVLVVGAVGWSIRGGASNELSLQYAPPVDTESLNEPVADTSPTGPERAPVDMVWTFENGPPAGLKVLLGAWTWDRYRSGMVVGAEQTLVKLPVDDLRYPVIVEQACVSLDWAKRVQCTSVWCEDSMMPAYSCWFKMVSLKQRGMSVRTQDYFLPGHKVSRIGDQVQSIVRLEEDETPTRIVSVLKDCVIREIRIREVTMDEIPEEYRDLGRLVDLQDAQAEHHPRKMLPGPTPQ